MNAFIIFLQLARSEPVITVTADSCEALQVWYINATAWAERSHVRPEYGPAYFCHRLSIEDHLRNREAIPWKPIGYSWPKAISKPVASGLAEARGL